MATDKVPGHVAVVGAGMSGLATAWYLQEQGVEVTVLEREDVAAGSSWGNAGWLAPALTLPLSEPSVLSYGLKAMFDPSAPLYIPLRANPQLLRFLAGFARHCTPGKWRQAMATFTEVNRIGLDAFDELAGECIAGKTPAGDRTKAEPTKPATRHSSPALASGNVNEPTHPAQPFLAAFATDKHREGLIREFDGVAQAGGKVEYELLTGDEMRDFEPTLADGVGVGIAIHGQRFIDPPRYMASLAKGVEQRGARIERGFNVTDIQQRGAGIDVIDQAGEHVRADHVVIATGAWLGRLARRFGIKQVVQAGRGYSFTVVPQTMPTHPIYFPTERVACTPLGDRFRVTGMMEFRDPDAPLDPRRIQAIIDASRPMYRGINWQNRQEEWVGSRPCTTDGLPLIGRTRNARVSIAGGHGMWGITLGPLTGKMLATQLVGKQTPSVMKLFDPLR